MTIWFISRGRGHCFFWATTQIRKIAVFCENGKHHSVAAAIMITGLLHSHSTSLLLEIVLHLLCLLLSSYRGYECVVVGLHTTVFQILCHSQFLTASQHPGLGHSCRCWHTMASKWSDAWDMCNGDCSNCDWDLSVDLVPRVLQQFWDSAERSSVTH